MITVPPTHSISSTMDDHRLMNASVPPREDIVYNAMNIWTIDMKRMKYLKWSGGIDELTLKKKTRQIHCANFRGHYP